MLGTPLACDDPTDLEKDLRAYWLEALGADAPGKLVEDVVKLTAGPRLPFLLGNQVASCRSCAEKRIVHS